jgi:hypothetical protein
LATSGPDTVATDISDPARSLFFPPSFSQRSVSCGLFSRSMPLLSKIERDWFSSQLEAAKEPMLYEASLRSRRVGAWTIRFTWLRSFDPGIVVRIEGDGNKRTLIAKQLSGAGGYDPGRIAAQVLRPLTAQETKSLGEELSKLRLFDLQPKECDLGVDGADWLFEGVDSNGYQFVSRWSPRKGEAHELGLYLLSLTGWHFKNRDIY